MRRVRKAFSLIEVIFVLVILGVVASISSSIIAQVYENYIIQKALYNVTTKTELVANQIVNSLAYRIQGTTIAKDSTKTGVIEGTDWIQLKDIPKLDNNFTTIEWIGYDNDSFSAGGTPYWSGVANYESADRTSFDTPASTLTTVATIMSTLSKGSDGVSKVTLTQSKPAAVIFSQENNYYKTDSSDVLENQYNPRCMGLIDSNTSCIFPVFQNSDTNLTFVDDKPIVVTERYKLAWSAYALVPEDLDNDGLYDLFLYYNYQPWNGENYDDSAVEANRKLLMTNVSVFKFTENGGVIQFKLCASENIGQDFNISTCKEKAIIR